MPSFSRSSKLKLDTCHPDLQRIMKEVVKFYDCTVLEGFRDRVRQDTLYAEQKTKVQYPDSKHNLTPSMAIDVAPYPIDWSGDAKNLARYYYLAGCIRGVAAQLRRLGEIEHEVRFGGDWDSDDFFDDNSFDDLVHFELRKP